MGAVMTNGNGGINQVKGFYNNNTVRAVYGDGYGGYFNVWDAPYLGEPLKVQYAEDYYSGAGASTLADTYQSNLKAYFNPTTQMVTFTGRLVCNHGDSMSSLPMVLIEYGNSQMNNLKQANYNGNRSMGFTSYPDGASRVMDPADDNPLFTIDKMAPGTIDWNMDGVTLQLNNTGRFIPPQPSHHNDDNYNPVINTTTPLLMNDATWNGDIYGRLGNNASAVYNSANGKIVLNGTVRVMQNAIMGCPLVSFPDLPSKTGKHSISVVDNWGNIPIICNSDDNDHLSIAATTNLSEGTYIFLGTITLQVR